MPLTLSEVQDLRNQYESVKEKRIALKVRKKQLQEELSKFEVKSLPDARKLLVTLDRQNKKTVQLINSMTEELEADLNEYQRSQKNH